MRIEIFSSGGATVSDFQNKVSNLCNSIDCSINELRQIENNINDVNSGPNSILSEAYDNINLRIRSEENKKAGLQKVLQKSETFVSNAVSIDYSVAHMVDQNQQKFFQSYSRLKPVETEEKYSWEQWLDDLSGSISTLKEVFSTVGEWVESAADWVRNLISDVCEYVKEHAVELIVGTVVIAIGAVLTVITGGAVLTVGSFLVAFLGGVVKVAIASALDAIIAGVFASITGGDFGEAFSEAFAAGYCIGGILYMGHSIIQLVKYIKVMKAAPNVKVIDTSYKGTKRTGWRASEKTMAENAPGYREQVSFDKSGKNCAYGEVDSCRLDLFKGGTLIDKSIEVKNYNLQTKEGIRNVVNVITKQYYERLESLPNIKNTFTSIFHGKLPKLHTIQQVAFDIRGQIISMEEMEAIMKEVMKKTKNGIKNFYILK